MKKLTFSLLIFSLILGTHSLLAKDKDPEVAVIQTSKGQMVLEFWEKEAPETVKNFKKLAKKGFYDKTAFHRIIKGFMVQGGDPLSKEPDNPRVGTGDPGYKIKGEVNKRSHERGVISMAHSGHPDTAGSQFFICLDAAPHLNGMYTAFGKVIKGEDVLLSIGETPVKASFRGEKSVPQQRIEVKSIKILPKSKVKGNK